MELEKLKRLAPGARSRLNLLVDLGSLFAALLVTTQLGGRTGPYLPQLLWFGVAASATWMFTATALRHYNPWAWDREPLDDAAMASVLVMAITTILGLAKL